MLMTSRLAMASAVPTVKVTTRLMSGELPAYHKPTLDYQNAGSPFTYHTKGKLKSVKKIKIIKHQKKGLLKT